MGNAVDQLLFQPPTISYIHAKKHLVWIRTKRNVDIPAFYIDRKAKVSVIFSHGNAEDLGMIFEWLCDFSLHLNVNVLGKRFLYILYSYMLRQLSLSGFFSISAAYDYEGYGKAPGVPSEASCYLDIDAAYGYLSEVLLFQPQNIIVYGRSLGTGPSVYLAERLAKDNVKLGGLVLQVSGDIIYHIFQRLTVNP
jgi:fermentation-respiration switch protein FrsA (DUF1100 family)